MAINHEAFIKPLSDDELINLFGGLSYLEIIQTGFKIIEKYCDNHYGYYGKHTPCYYDESPCIFSDICEVVRADIYSIGHTCAGIVRMLENNKDVLGIEDNGGDSLN